MKTNEIINAIKEWLNVDWASFGDDVTITVEPRADGDDAIVITVWKIHVLSIYRYGRENMNHSGIINIAQMIRSAWIIGRIQFLNGERSGFHQAENIWRKSQ